MDTNRDRTEIRQVSVEDVPELCELLAELEFPAGHEEVEARLGSVLEGTLVAVRQDKVIGVLTTNIMPVLHRPAPVGRISALVVAGRERGRGVGRALVAAAERLLKERGCGLVEVTSNFRLESAHAFYRHMGYEATSFRFGKELL